VGIAVVWPLKVAYGEQTTAAAINITEITVASPRAFGRPS
jgi:hypothetical protein